MNRERILIDLANILVETFDTSGIEDTVENYATFVQDFAKEHDMKIYGGMVHPESGWRTTGFDFNTKEAELFFKLKYGAVEVS